MMTPSDVTPFREPSSPDRPAAERLAAQGATAEWEKRAEWLEIEAKAQRDPAARARLLLAASEVRALLGARADARRLALQAANHQPAPPFAARQARALHQTHGDVSALARGLADEARASESSELAAHALCLSAEIQRLLQRDAPGARASLEAAQAAHPGHARASLERLLLELSLGQAPPQVQLPAGSDWEPLRRAVDVIRRLRGELGVPTDPEFADAVALADVQHALASNDLAAAAEALAPLAAHAGLLPAVRWVAAVWRTAAAPDAEAALEAARALAREQPGRAARRALAARALRAGRWDALQEALAEPAAGGLQPAFSSLERAALAALLGRGPEAPASLATTEAPAVTSIAAAVARASSAPPSAPAATPSSEEEAEFWLGRAAASLASLSEAHADGPASPWTLALRLERSRALGDWSGVARELPRLLEAPGAAAESSFVAAVLAERAGDLGEARELLQASLPSASTREAATRALTEKGSDGAALLRALSAHTSDPQRRALLLTEAAFRLDPTAPEFDALVEDAARLYPALPFAVELGEAAAKARGDRPRAARWLARRREFAQGGDDFTLAALREALSPSLDRAGAAERWQELLARHPDDLLLAIAAERRLEPPARGRAELRRRMAPQLGARGRQRFLAEAIGLYEAAGDRATAFALAHELGGPLAEFMRPRLASAPEEFEELAREWLRAAQRASSPELAAELYERLGELERRRGRPERALEWERERLVHEPGSLEALRALDLASMAPGRTDAELAQTASALFDRLGEHDGAGYAFLAARLAIARGAFDKALPFARRLLAASVPPLWALRLDAIHARIAGDDRTLLAACRALRERSSQALDAATLSLHAAEAALRLGEPHVAKEEIERASELAPDDIVILSARAEVLRENGDHADAAEAFETLASATSSKQRQVEALYQAAVLWLDRLNHRARGMLALQEAASCDIPHSGLLERLVALRAQSDDLDGLAELVERQRTRAAEAAVDLGSEAIALEGPDADQDSNDDAALEQRVARHTQNEAWAEAAHEQRELLGRARDEIERRGRLLHLVKLLDRLPTGASEAESLLEQARRTWPDDASVLEAEIAHYVALGHPGTAHLVAERAAQAARAAIAAGRLEAAPFRALEAAARLAADPDGALAARAMARAIAGGPPEHVRGAGVNAGDLELDELLAPPPLTPELRRILYLAGSAIERAYALDPASLNARPAPEAVVARVREFALGFGLEHVRVLSSGDVDVDAISLGMDPPCLVLGDALIEQADPALEDFLVLRALKLARANASALSRLSPLDGWAVLAGFFACFGPLAPASGPDAQRLLLARSRLRPHVTWAPEPPLSDRVAALMEDVLPHAGRLADAVCRWGTRVALLGVGDPAIAFDALSGRDRRALRDEEARMRWIAGHSVARDLVSFGVSEAYIEARQRAGLGAVARPGHPPASTP